MKPEQERVKQVIAESVTHMCRTGIAFQKEMRIEAVIGITIDTDDVMLIHINEKFDGKDVTTKDMTSDPSFIIGDITQRVFTKVNATPAKETPQSRRSNGTAKVPVKRAPGKRGRKQKLVPMTNGQISEKVVTDPVPDAVCLSTETNDCSMAHDRDNYDLSSIMIKSEPPDQIIQNGVSDDAESLTTKAVDTTTKSDDDTLAMQQGYTEHATSEQLPTYKEKLYSPPRKRQMLSSHVSENQEQSVVAPAIDSLTKPGQEDRVSSLSPPSWPSVSTTTMDDSISSSPADQKTSATSTWCSPTQSKSRSRRPSNGLQSTAVKRMLSEYLVEPIAQTDCKVCTFRLMWHGSVTESEQVWSQLPYYQEAIDRIITEPAQVALAVSAVTATSTRPKSGSGKLAPTDTPDKFRTFPGLAYWIVLQNEQDFTETDLYNRIYENCFGARLKSLSDQAVASDLQEMCSTLYLVVKDNVDGYVRWKLDAVLPSTDGEILQPVVKVYARAEQDFNTLLMAREALQKNRFYFSLLKTDVQ